MNRTETLKARGLIQDISDAEAFNNLAPNTPVYVGFDPTASSLTIGNLLQIIMLIRLSELNLKPVMLFGGATGAIGDPSGKSVERPLLSRETISANIAKQRAQAEAIFERHHVTPLYVDNYEWTKDLSIIDFLREVGKHFTVNYMVAKEVVKSRLEGEGMSYTEFSYMLLQSYDFLHLYQSIGCRAQFGGSDQWGNITAGLELIRKKISGDALAFSLPLLLDSRGKKFGKSEGNAVWLDPELTSPYRFHQFWLNQEDSDVLKLIRYYTFADDTTIAELEASMKEKPEARMAQNYLADSVCTLAHGKEATEAAKRCAKVLFGGSLEGLSVSDLKEIFKDAPSSQYTKSEIAALPIAEIFVRAGLSKSKGEARRLIEQGGAYLNNVKIEKFDSTLSTQESVAVLRAGKKNYHLVQLV